MKKLISFLICCCIFLPSFAVTGPVKGPVIKASDFFLPVGVTGTKISLQALAVIRTKELESLTGNKMSLSDKIGFAVSQRKLRKMIDADGMIDLARAGKRIDENGDTGFNFGGFALGFFLGPIGVITAYLINDRRKKARVKWAWLGFATCIALNLLLIGILLIVLGAHGIE